MVQSNAGDVGSIPDQGTKTPHSTGQVSLHHNLRSCMTQLRPTAAKLKNCDEETEWLTQSYKANRMQCLLEVNSRSSIHSPEALDLHSFL